jgi:hypothetical protein
MALSFAFNFAAEHTVKFAAPSTELPGTQRLNGHKIGEDDFTLCTGKSSLQYIATAQIALRTWNCTIGRSYLKVAPSFSIQQATEDSRAIEVGQTSPIDCTIWSYKYYRMTISDDTIGINWLIIAINGLHPTHPLVSDSHVKKFAGNFGFPYQKITEQITHR